MFVQVVDPTNFSIPLGSANKIKRLARSLQLISSTLSRYGRRKTTLTADSHASSCTYENGMPHVPPAETEEPSFRTAGSTDQLNNRI